MTTKYMQSTHNPFNSQGKMFHHADRISEYKMMGDTIPILVEINPTNKCNLDCVWCISKYAHKTESLELGELITFLQDFQEQGGKAVTWSGGGEPTTYPYLERGMQAASDAGLQQGIMTNGLVNKNRLIENHCNWVRFSLDTWNEKRYRELKGVDGFQKVLINIQDINKKKIKVGINMNMPQEEGFQRAVFEMIHLSKRLGVRYFQVRPVLPVGISVLNDAILARQMQFLKVMEETEPILTVSWDKFNDLLKPDFGRSYNGCKGHRFECVLDANGDLQVCMYHLKNKNFNFGNIYKDRFATIWESHKYAVSATR